MEKLSEEERQKRRKDSLKRAWKKWYDGPKGKAYRLKQKMESAGVKSALCAGCEDQTCKSSGCIAS